MRTRFRNYLYLGSLTAYDLAQQMLWILVVATFVVMWLAWLLSLVLCAVSLSGGSPIEPFWLGAVVWAYFIAGVAFIIWWSRR